MNKSIIILTATILMLFGFTNNILGQQVDKTLSPYFFIDSDNPSIDQLPLKSTSADVNISGVIAHVTVEQVYKNEGIRPIEAIYNFPASTKAAINGMKMIIGDRIIEAEIQEKEKARKTYEKAKEQGKRTSLLEQQRPNVFQMNVANILPNDEVKVVLTYTEILVPTEGVYEFVYPTVVGPRYSNQNLPTASVNSTFVSTPYTKSGVEPSYSFDLNIHLTAGMPMQHVHSNSHKINVAYLNSTQANIGLKDVEKAGGNRDFILNYQLVGAQIESGLMLYEGKEENFFTLMIQPPKRVQSEHIPPREFIFVVDVSGSMFGFPLDVSKTLLRNLITNLRPTDRFNVILFAGTAYMMSEESLLCNTQNINLAMQVIEGKRGSGGTNLLPALEKALYLPRCTSGLSRSIVVVTDGYISVEKEAYDLIRNNLNQTNVFAFGIGSSVNRYLIEGLANVGMGEPFVITSSANAAQEAEKFRKYIENPVLTEITANFGDFEVYDVYPTSIPDVLAERPVMIYGKWKGKPKGKIAVQGFSGDVCYKSDFKVEEVIPDPRNEGLKFIWAREKVKLLDDYKLVDRNSNTAKLITDLGLKYNMITDYTSFVAVDKMVVNKSGEPYEVKQALPLPQGVANSAVGFDMTISNVVRKSQNKSIQKIVSLGDFECSLEEAEVMILRNSISNLLNTELAKSGIKFNKSEFEIHLTINELGLFESFKLLNIKDKSLEKYIEYIISGWQIKELNPTRKVHMVIPINIL